MRFATQSLRLQSARRLKSASGLAAEGMAAGLPLRLTQLTTRTFLSSKCLNSARTQYLKARGSCRSVVKVDCVDDCVVLAVARNYYLFRKPWHVPNAGRGSFPLVSTVLKGPCVISLQRASLGIPSKVPQLCSKTYHPYCATRWCGSTRPFIESSTHTVRQICYDRSLRRLSTSLVLTTLSA